MKTFNANTNNFHEKTNTYRYFFEEAIYFKWKTHKFNEFVFQYMNNKDPTLVFNFGGVCRSCDIYFVYNNNKTLFFPIMDNIYSKNADELFEEFDMDCVYDL